MHRRSFLLAATVSLTLPARAQSWPARPIKLVVPFPPGSSPDIIARVIAEPLGPALGASIVIDNRPGAGGNLGTGVVAKAEAGRLHAPVHDPGSARDSALTVEELEL